MMQGGTSGENTNIQMMQTMMQMMQMMQKMSGAPESSPPGGSPQQMMQMMQQTGAAQQAMATSDSSKGGGKGKDGTPSDNLYIKGLPSPQADPEMLFRLFTDLGLQVTRHKLIADTKGYGVSAAMVQLASVAEAQSAMTQLNGQEHFGNTLTLFFAPAKGGPPPSSFNYQPKGLSKGGSTYLRVFAKDDTQGTNLFLHGLPSPTVDQAALEKVFSERGFTVARSRLLPDTRGAGFSCAMVELTTWEEAAAAIEQLNGQSVQELNLVAKQMSDNPGFDENNMPIHGNLFVGNIPKEFSEQELMMLFQQCGAINSCKIHRHTDGTSKGSGFVKFETKEEARMAIDLLNGLDNLMVKPAPADLVPDKGAGEGGGKDGWGKDSWGWGSGSWGKDNRGTEGKVIAPPNRTANEPEVSATFAGENGEESSSDTLFIFGLPSPDVGEQRLAEVFTQLGFPPVSVATLPADADTKVSSAMIQFESVETASQARTAVDSKKPSQLGLSAKSGGKGQTKEKPSYGKAAAAHTASGPYSQGGKGAAKKDWDSWGWDGGYDGGWDGYDGGWGGNRRQVQSVVFKLLEALQNDGSW